MSMKYRFLLFAISLLMVFGTSMAQDKSAPVIPLRVKDSKEQIIKRLDIVVPRLLEVGLVPGLSIAIVQKGELVWHKGYGVKNAQTKEPVVANTVFEAASLSKPVFA